MNFKFFLHGIKNIILDPVKAWEAINSENRPVKLVRDSFFFPLIILVSVSTFTTAFVFSETTYPLDLGFAYFA